MSRDDGVSTDDLPQNVFTLPGVTHPLAFPAGEATPAVQPVQAPVRALAPPPPHLMEAAVEALLLATPEPATDEQLDAWLGGPGLTAVRTALDAIRTRLRRGAGGMVLVLVARGWQLRTAPAVAPWVAACRGGPPLKLSRAALEALSIVAYRQPVTKTGIEELRGCDSSAVLKVLVEADLVWAALHADEAGRPAMYCTTTRFLEVFGLRDLCDLPPLRDLRAMRGTPPGADPFLPDDDPDAQVPLPLGVPDLPDDEDEDETETEGAGPPDEGPTTA